MIRWGTLVLAAGQGSRMNSDLPKVLHPLCGVELVRHVLSAVQAAGASAPLVVVPPEHQQLRQALGPDAAFVVQRQPRGTADAVAQARTALRGKVDALLVVNGDLPLIRPETLQRLQAAFLHSEAALALLTVAAAQSDGMGLVRRDAAGRVVSVVEARELSEGASECPEANVGAYCFKSDWLWRELPRLTPGSSGELYLTGLVARAAEQGVGVADVAVSYSWEALGINTRLDLAKAEAVLRQRIREWWMLEGVTLLDPATTYIDAQVVLERDTQLWPNTFLLGNTRVGRGSTIGPNSLVNNSVIGARCRVLASVLEDATLEDDVDIGPYSHLRERAYLARGVHMGNFGEVKNSRLGPEVKVGHFSYIGDADIGAGTNIGAGTVTCNFDGTSKHRTEVGEGAFIGSDTMLVAPIKIGARARTGAGSVVTKDVPDGALAVGAPARVNRRRSRSKAT